MTTIHGYTEIDNTGEVPGKRATLVLGAKRFGEVTNTVCRANETRKPPMAWTVTSALIGSLLFSLSLVPLLCYFLLRKRLSEKENIVVRACKRVYQPVLSWALDHRWLVIGAAVGVLAFSLSIVPLLGSEIGRAHV